jgi:hypothetical protein
MGQQPIVLDKGKKPWSMSRVGVRRALDKTTTSLTESPVWTEEEIRDMCSVTDELSN